jgi:hypothetical protein
VQAAAKSSLKTTEMRSSTRSRSLRLLRQQGSLREANRTRPVKCRVVATGGSLQS